MPSRKKGHPALGLLVALACAPTAARADYAFTPDQLQVVPFQETSFTDILSFNKFDTSLGVLHAVDVQFTGLLHGEFQDIYAGTGPQDITDLGHGQVSISGPASLSLTAPLDINTGAVTLTGGSISMSKDTSSVLSESLTNAAALAVFSGPGTVDLTVSGSKFLTGYTVTNGNGTATILLADGAYASLRYEYTPAQPAPGGTGGGTPPSGGGGGGTPPSGGGGGGTPPGGGGGGGTPPGGGSTPEPAGLVLMAIGGGVLLLAGRGRRNSKRARTPEASGAGPHA